MHAHLKTKIKNVLKCTSKRMAAKFRAHMTEKVKAVQTIPCYLCFLDSQKLLF